MLELLMVLGIVLGVIALVATAKVALAILLLPFKVLFWALAGVFKLILLPFQFLGGLILAVILLPLLLLAIPLLLGIGLPLLVIFGILLTFWIVGGILALVGSVLCGIG